MEIRKNQFIGSWPGIFEITRQEFTELTDPHVSFKCGDSANVGSPKRALATPKLMTLKFG